MDVKQIYFVRHGNTGFSGRYIGTSDVPITKDGRSVVLATKQRLRSIAFDAIFCSPMLRCRQTLELLDRKENVAFSTLLTEIDFGRWEKKSFAEIVKDDAELVDSWVMEPENFVFPEGESYHLFTRRIHDFYTEIKGIDAENVLVITHGGVIRHLLCMFLGIPEKNYLLFDVQPGQVTAIRLHDQGGVLTGLNF
ncbi:histidine phosphatase family protein [Desulforhopalus singaporensis]|uniref:Alpha-ribazole phosphatase n=1 Tax=Desulforhopalus singaporensis TaxID=91360 RepID=A0A1H0PHC5_9BACT|nr:histidine phosphatase family protein [Desulforhopalus singaporensis]SDP04457.1 alpha-ribazole phosphatase [Desulforhopalus singaporensis]